MTDMPDDLRDVDQKLRLVRFVPRASFGPEVRGQLRRGDQPSGRGHWRLRWQLGAAAVLVLTAAGALALASFGTLAHIGAVSVDRCCYDLDGGGDADDGVLILAERDDQVHRLRVYEDLDGSRTFTAADMVRLDRGAEPALHGLAGQGMFTIERCCLDFDGGGPADDGILVIGVPPDRVLMAAIYETGSGSRPRSARGAGWPLR